MKFYVKWHLFIYLFFYLMSQHNIMRFLINILLLYRVSAQFQQNKIYYKTDTHQDKYLLYKRKHDHNPVKNNTVLVTNFNNIEDIIA